MFYVLLLLSCSESGNDLSVDQPKVENQSDEEIICVYFRDSALGGKGFMGMQYTAMIALHIEENFELVLETIEGNELYTVKTHSIDPKCNVIVSTEGFTMKQFMVDLAMEYPDKTFIVMDELLAKELPNLASFYFVTAEAAYLAGILAADMSQTGVLGILGGRSITPVNDFIVGFQQGAQATNPSIKVITKYIDQVDLLGNPWTNLGVASEITQQMFSNNKADIIFAVAGGSNLGVFVKAKELGIKAIGVDVDQDYLAKGAILTSVVKNVDIALKRIVVEYLNGNFKSGNRALALADGGVGISEMKYTISLIPQATIDKLEKARTAIIKGKIIVRSAWEKNSIDPKIE